MLIALLLVISGISCEKKGDFIDEDKIGKGIHYYPQILNNTYSDTITNKRFNDTTFIPGQQIAFQLKYKSQDSLSKIELWISETGKKTQKIWETDYSASFYSEYQQCDTTFILAQLPENIDSTVHSLDLLPKVITQKGLVAESTFSLELEH